MRQLQGMLLVGGGGSVWGEGIHVETGVLGSQAPSADVQCVRVWGGEVKCPSPTNKSHH